MYIVCSFEFAICLKLYLPESVDTYRCTVTASHCQPLYVYKLRDQGRSHEWCVHDAMITPKKPPLTHYHFGRLLMIE